MLLRPDTTRPFQASIVCLSRAARLDADMIRAEFSSLGLLPGQRHAGEVNITWLCLRTVALLINVTGTILAELIVSVLSPGSKSARRSELALCGQFARVLGQYETTSLASKASAFCFRIMRL